MEQNLPVARPAGCLGQADDLREAGYSGVASPGFSRACFHRLGIGGKAVQLALPPQPRRIVTHRSEQDVPIRDNTTSKLAVAVGDTRAIKAVKVHVNIEHSYVGDLQVGIKPPPATGIGEIVLHRAGTGGGNDNLVETCDEVNAPDLAALRNLRPTGNWTLIVRDNARQDEGTLKSVTLQFAL